MLKLSAAGGGEALFRLEVADSWLARLRGLIGRSGVGRDEGLYLAGTNGVHMFFMRFPIDCVFLGAPQPDGTRQIVAVKSELQPWRGIVWWVRGAKAAVEVTSGAAAAAGLQAGDFVRLDPTA
ncbi:MAG TPA: DUF192 domain-containing protein [Candidatus Limnocylindrales bacterium]|nr:DUF192 domain-containing protein [Candidatus Limnocylindrales bacterium]